MAMLQNSILLLSLLLLITDSHVVLRVSRDTSGCPNCVTNLTSALESASTNTSVLIYSGNYDLLNVTFDSVSHITLEKYREGIVVINCAREGTGIAFQNVHNMTITGLEFVGCGRKHFSTSRDFGESRNEQLVFSKFNASLYFLWSSNITMEDVIVRESLGIAIQMYGVIGSNVIANCTFKNNPGGSQEQGGGVYIEFPYCHPGNASCINGSDVHSESISNAIFLIKGNWFENNIARIYYNRSTFIVPNRIYHDAFGRGGGLSIYFKGKANSNTMLIENNTFKDNQAVFGGGLFLEFQDSSYNNSITLTKQNSFSGNVAIKSGGGMHLSFISLDGVVELSVSSLQNNKIAVIDSLIENNKAEWGGGVSFLGTREYGIVYSTNKLSFESCRWLKNVARIGSGLDLSVLRLHSNGVLLEVVITSSTFVCNSVMYNPSMLGYGALYTDSIPITFKESILFENNYDGSGLVVANTRINFSNSTVAIFNGNMGRDGAAIYFAGYAFLLVHYNTTFNFTNNSASNLGGAMFAYYPDGRELISSRNCFIRYFNIITSPYVWETSFFFSDNTANGIPNSIFTTTVLPCLWGRVYGQASIGNLSQDVFCWSNKWNYDNSNCSEQIKTDPAHLRKSENVLKVIPGKNTPLKITVYDDQQVDVTNILVLSATSNSPQNIKVDERYQYISTDSIVLYQKNHEIVNNTLAMETFGPRVLRTNLSVEFQECPPGLTLSADLGSCVCNGNFHYYIRCYNSTFSSTILRGYWIGHHNAVNNNIVIGLCRFCHYDHSGSHVELGESFEDVQKRFCASNNRDGTFCSQCKEGFTVAVNSYDYECVKCTDVHAKYHWIFFILLKVCLPLTLFLGIYLFNFSVTSGLLNGAIFYAQILTTAIPLDGGDTIPFRDILKNSTQLEETLENIYTIIYSVWNLDVCSTCFPLFCLHPNTNGLDILVIEYVIAFLPFLIVFVVLIIYWIDLVMKVPVCCLGIIRKVCSCFSGSFSTLKENAKNALVAFIILSYSKIAVITTYLIAPTPFYNVSGHRINYVLYFDGSILYKDIVHQHYAFPVFISSSLLLFIVPLILILCRYDNPQNNGGFLNWLLYNFQYPFKAPSDSNKVCDLFRSVDKDDETDITIPLGCCTRQDKFKYHFKFNTPKQNLSCKLNCCHGYCGCLSSWSVHDFRWVAGAYLILRLFYLVVYIASDNFMVQFQLQLILSVLTAVFFLLFQPYKKHLHNVVDACFFLLLAIILSFSMYQYYLTVAGSEPSLRGYITQYVLVLLPAFWISGCLIYECYKQKVFEKLKKESCHCKCKRKEYYDESTVVFDNSYALIRSVDDISDENID